MPESESLLRTDEGFEAFYTRHYKLVYRTCFSYMKNTADAEDCTEDVFVKVLTGQYSFEDENHEKAWLTVTAMLMALNIAMSSFGVPVPGGHLYLNDAVICIGRSCRWMTVPSWSATVRRTSMKRWMPC